MRLTGLPIPLTLPTEPIRQVADSPHAYPCRRCLCDARPGEVLLLVSYDPWTTDSVYRQPGPIFVHERECIPWSGDGLPEQQRRRLLSLRGYDSSGMSTVAEVIAGDTAEKRLEDVLADGRTAFVHLHNAGPGCFAARAERS